MHWAGKVDYGPKLNQEVTMRAIFLLLLAVSLLVACAAPPIREQAYEPGRILPISEYRKLKDPAALNRHAAYLDAGDRLPLKLAFESAFLQIEQNQIDLVAKQRLFFRVVIPEDMTQAEMEKILLLDHARLAGMDESEKRLIFKDFMILASPDALRWAPLNDMQALKALFEIQGGELSLGVSMSAEEGIWSSLSLKLK
jgi:hypothetical protein